MARLAADGAHLVTALGVFLALDVLSVILRLISKQQTTARFSLDDLWMIFALVCFIAFAGVLMASVIDVSGTYDIPMDTPQFSMILKLIWVSELFITWGITLVKTSILSLYGTLFVTRKFLIAQRIVLGLCLAWCIAETFVIIFECYPVQSTWDPQSVADGKCISFGNFIFTYELANLCLDVIIICLPVFVIKTLQLPMRQKCVLSLIFLLGGFVCVTGILRIKYSFDPKAPNTVPSIPLTMLWTSIEFGTAIICGNLPTYRPLMQSYFCPAPVRRWFASVLETARGHGATVSSKRSLPSYHSTPIMGLKSVDEEIYGDQVHLNGVAWSGRTQSMETDPKIPPHAITVEKRIEVV